jgi:NADH-quinone oxidoreductase subunit E/NADP-reducing hydrogenase subunit HndA
MNQKINIAPTVFDYMEKVTGSDGVEVRVNLPKEKIDKINDICNDFGNDPGELINVLHEVQHTFGYIPAEVQDIVAQVYGVVTFYTFFTMIPKGEHPVSVCTGTACYVRGAERVLDEFRKELGVEVGETTPDGRFSINCLRCVGACGLAPVVLVGEKVHGRVSPDGVKAIIAEYKK